LPTTEITLTPGEYISAVPYANGGEKTRVTATRNSLKLNADTVTVNNFADINSFEVGVATVTKELYADKIYLGTSPAYGHAR